jgi:hypothetical protein
MRKVIATSWVLALLCSMTGCGEGGGSPASTNATGPPPPPADQEKLFQKPGPKGAPKKGAFLNVAGTPPVVVS